MSTIKLNRPIRYFTAQKRRLVPMHTIEAGEPIHLDDLMMMELNGSDVRAVAISFHHHRFYILYDDLDPAAQKLISANGF